MKYRPSELGVLLLGTGALVFALTFLHLYVTKIYPDNRNPGYVSCGGNGTMAMVSAGANLKGVVVTSLPSGERCSLGSMGRGSSDVCMFNSSAEFFRVEYEGGRFVQQCYYPRPIPA